MLRKRCRICCRSDGTSREKPLRKDSAEGAPVMLDTMPTAASLMRSTLRRSTASSSEASASPAEAAAEAATSWPASRSAMKLLASCCSSRVVCAAAAPLPAFFASARAASRSAVS
jgi:hypothetical protein